MNKAEPTGLSWIVTYQSEQPEDRAGVKTVYSMGQLQWVRQRSPRDLPDPHSF